MWYWIETSGWLMRHQFHPIIRHNASRPIVEVVYVYFELVSFPPLPLTRWFQSADIHINLLFHYFFHVFKRGYATTSYTEICEETPDALIPSNTSALSTSHLSLSSSQVCSILLFSKIISLHFKSKFIE